MTTEQLNNHIDGELEKLERIASEHVKRLAMVVLKKNNNAVQFTMAMGTFFFSDHNGVLWHHEMEVFIGYKELNDFIRKWDNILKITGEPMKFKNDGLITTDW